MIRIIALICIICITGCSGGGGPNDPVTKDIYVMVGQSNMTQSDKGRDYQYLCDAYGDDGWEKAETPLIQYSSIKKYPKVGRVGIADGFAESICTKGVGLIIHARGGMSIDDIMPSTEPYQLLLSRLDSIGSYNIKAFIWHQGEADRDDEQYADKLSMMIEALRYDTQDAPLIIGEINGRSLVNDYIRLMPITTPDTYLVTPDGLTTHDGTHFNEPSALEYGYRYAEIASNLEE